MPRGGGVRRGRASGVGGGVGGGGGGGVGGGDKGGGDKGGSSFIGLLDIFGNEVFGINS